MVTSDSWDMLSLYNHYTAGHLPFDGGILSQPNAFSDAMQIIAAELNSD